MIRFVPTVLNGRQGQFPAYRVQDGDRVFGAVFCVSNGRSSAWAYIPAPGFQPLPGLLKTRKQWSDRLSRQYCQRASA